MSVESESPRVMRRFPCETLSPTFALMFVIVPAICGRTTAVWSEAACPVFVKDRGVSAPISKVSTFLGGIMTSAFGASSWKHPVRSREVAAKMTPNFVIILLFIVLLLE